MAHHESFLRDKFKNLSYPNAATAVNDAKVALEQYPTLKPVQKLFNYPDGKKQQLVCLEGTVPVNYRGNIYNIPICIWLQDRHPFIPPICYVVPTNEMEIKTGRHVDHYGRVYLPFLTEWKHPQSDLYGLVQVLCLIFAEQPPVFARTKPKPPPPTTQSPHQLQHPGYPQYPTTTTQNPPYPSGHTAMPTPGGAQQGPNPTQYHGMPQPATTVNQPQPGRPKPPSRPPPPSPSYPPPGGFPMPGMTNQPPYPVSTTGISTPGIPAPAGGITRNVPGSFVLSDDMMKNSLKSAVEEKMKRCINEKFSQSQAEMASLRKTESDLKEGRNKLENMIKQIEKEEAEVSNDIITLTQKNQEIEELVKSLENQSDKLNIDEAVVPTTPLYNQILELYAEENALDDTMYYLSEALRKEKIELDVFLKHVRSLSRRQFTCRALLQKARKTAGLSEL